MDDFEKELKLGFLDEATQLLEETEQCFLALEKDPSNISEVEKLFRLAHNFKGSSKAVGFNELGLFTHDLETFLLNFKSGKLKLTQVAISLLLECNDLIRIVVDNLKVNLDYSFDGSTLVQKMKNFSDSPTEVHSPPAPEPQTPPSEPIAHDASEAAPPPPPPETPEDILLRAAGKFDEGGFDTTPISPTGASNTMPEAEAQPSANTRLSTEAKKTTPTQATPADETIRVSLARVEKLINYVGEMVILETFLKAQPQLNEHPILRKTVHQLSKVTKEVQELSMSLRMVPLKQTFQKMQRIVRDTSSTLGKSVEFHMEGETTEVDKTVYELLGDPLVHLVRNAIDHGIESSAEERVAAGKSPSGRVDLRAYHKGGSLIIEIIDDGKGMDPQRLREKAIEKGVISPNRQMTNEECYNLIFAPGFSTKAQATEVSGRGVGMDVVKTNIEAIQGRVEIETEKGKGSLFRICLPLTLAIIDGMIVAVEKEKFVIPISQVLESIHPKKDQIKKTTELGDILLLRGQTLPLFRLSDLLGKKVSTKDDGIALVMLSEKRPYSVLVDDIVGQHEIVVKQLGEDLRKQKVFSGSAILGDGKPSLILELSELVRPRGVA